MDEEMMCEDCRKELEMQEDRWLCQCRCGNEMSVLGDDLRSGKSTSCGKCDDKVNTIEPIDIDYYQDIAKNMNLNCCELRVELLDLVEESRIYMNRITYELEKINGLLK